MDIFAFSFVALGLSVGGFFLGRWYERSTGAMDTDRVIELLDAEKAAHDLERQKFIHEIAEETRSILQRGGSLDEAEAMLREVEALERERWQ